MRINCFLISPSNLQASETAGRCKSVLVFCLERYQTLFFPMVLAETEKMTKLKFLTKTIDKPLKKNVRFSTFSNWYFYSQNGLFSIQNSTKHFFWAYLTKKERIKTFQIFDQNHGLTPLKKCEIFGFLKFLFLRARMACFLSRTAANTFSKPIWPKQKGWRNFQSFGQNQGLWNNIRFSTFSNWSFYSLERLVFYLKRHRKRFLVYFG